MPDHPEVTYIGKKALEILATRASGQVTGITHHGIFLDFGSWVVFLSTDGFQGPLTINLDSGWQDFHSIEPGMACYVKDRAFHFYEINLILNTAPAVVWEAPFPLDHILDAVKRRDRLDQIAAGILRQDPGGGFHQLLDPLVKHSMPHWDTKHPPGAAEALG